MKDDPKDKDGRPPGLADSQTVRGQGKLDKTYTKRGLVPGYEDGQYELRRAYDRRLASGALDEAPLKRDNRVNVRISSRDLQALQRKALREGVPTQSLLATIIHEHVGAHLQQFLPDTDDDDTDAGVSPVTARQQDLLKPEPPQD